MNSQPLPEPPVARVVPKVLTALDDSRVDNYYWLREKENPEVIEYLQRENDYTSAVMGSTVLLQRELYRELLGRIREDDTEAPYRKGSHLYYTRTERGKAYPIYCRRKIGDVTEQVLLDLNQLAQGQPYFSLGNFAVSANEQLLAYSTDTEGDETYTVRVKNFSTGEIYSDAIPNTYYSLAWANDNLHFFYVMLDSAKRPYQIWRHRLGVSGDTLVFEEPDERFELHLQKSRNEDYIFIQSESKKSSEALFIPADEPFSEWQVIWPRRPDVLYDVSARGDRFYIRTNDRAKDFRLVVAPVSNPAPENSLEVLPARPGVFIEDVEVFRRFVVSFERHAGLQSILLLNPETGDQKFIDFDEPAYAVSPGANAFYETDTLRFQYSSLTTPKSVYDYDMVTGRRELKKQTQVVGGYTPSHYQSERLQIAVRDGAKVPVSLVYRKGTSLNGSAPILLYGYGSYGINIDPSFSSDRLSLLDRGFVYAIAHIRGGADLGRSWYEDGRLLNKKNTFNDFVDVAQHLVDHKYTSPDGLVIQGGSAGGLLMGAVMNMRPDLFKAVVANVPFVDTLTTGLDPTLPLTIGEYEEFGNAAEPGTYEYIKSYSPYDNVGRKAYPNLLITAGLNDPRVSYWEPAKWAAKLRAMKTDANLLLLKTNLKAGHGGPSGRYERLKETAFVYAFIFKCLGLHE